MQSPQSQRWLNSTYKGHSALTRQGIKGVLAIWTGSVSHVIDREIRWHKDSIVLIQKWLYPTAGDDEFQVWLLLCSPINLRSSHIDQAVMSVLSVVPEWQPNKKGKRNETRQSIKNTGKSVARMSWPCHAAQWGTGRIATSTVKSIFWLPLRLASRSSKIRQAASGTVTPPWASTWSLTLLLHFLHLFKGVEKWGWLPKFLFYLFFFKKKTPVGSNCQIK
jgi:hypothetical protein